MFLQRQTLILPYIKVTNIHLIHERRLLHASVVFAANLIKGTLKVDFKKSAEYQSIVSNNKTPTNTDFAKDNK